MREAQPQILRKRIASGRELRLEGLLRGHGTEHHRDGDVVVGPVDDGDLIPCAHPSGRDDPKVRAWGTALREASDPQLLLEPAGKRPARDPWRCDLENAIGTDLPALPDARAADVEAARGQVLAEDPSRQRT